MITVKNSAQLADAGRGAHRRRGEGARRLAGAGRVTTSHIDAKIKSCILSHGAHPFSSATAGSPPLRVSASTIR